MKLKKGITNIFRWFNIFVIVGTLLSYAASLISPETFWWLSLFGLAYPVFLVLNIIFLFLFISLKSRTAFLSLACILLGWNYLSVMYANNPSSVAIPEKTPLTVCSFNILGLRAYYQDYVSQERGWQRTYANKEKFQPYADFFNGVKASVYCFQEHSFRNTYFNEFLEKQTPYSFKGYLSIYSKHPIINQGYVVGEEKNLNGAIFADIKIDTSIIRVYNVHLQSTGVASDAQKIKDEKDLESETTKNSIKNIVRRLRDASKSRAAQVDELAKHIKGSPYPVIVCGDFNDTPYSYTYQCVKSGLKDSFVERGNGFGVTYNGPIPTLRIDYILGSQKLNFLSHKILNTSISDHYPIVSQISY